MAKKTRTKSPGRDFDQFWIMVNISGPRYWKISRDGIERSVPEAGDGPVISFDENSDFRVVYSKGGNIKQATKYLLTEKQEKCRVFAGTKGNFGTGTFTPYYGTPIARIESFNHRIYSGAYFLDQLMAKNNVRLNEDRIIGFHFQAPGDDFNILVLFAAKPNGEMSDPQLSLKPSEYDLVLRDYAQTHGVDNFEPIFFGIDDMLSVPRGIGYPTEPMIGSTPVRYITRTVALGMLCVAGAAFAYAGFLKLTLEHAKSEITKAQQQAQNSRKQVEQIVEQNLAKLAERNSIHYESGFKFASGLYQRQFRIRDMQLSREGGYINVAVPMGNSKDFTYSDLERIILSELPTGLSRADTIIGGDGNEYKVKFKFQTLDSDLHTIVGAQ